VSSGVELCEVVTNECDRVSQLVYSEGDAMVKYKWASVDEEGKIRVFWMPRGERVSLATKSEGAWMVDQQLQSNVKDPPRSLLSRLARG